MTETEMQTEMVETEQTEQPSAEMVQVSKSELEKIRTALKERNAEAAKYRKQAEAAVAEEAKRKEAEMTELQKANQRAELAEQKAAQLERQSMQREIAAKVGLPARLADRLKGDTPEEMEADAQAILEDLPKPAALAKPGPGIIPANPGANGSSGETDDQRARRLGLR